MAASLQPHPTAIEELERRFKRAIREHAAPPEKLTVSMWADKYRILSGEDSAEPGRWSTDRTPYLQEIMDVFSDPFVQEVVFVAASQLGKTSVILNVLGYHIDQDPCPILVVLPNVEPFGKAWSRERLAPMIRDNPRVRDKVNDPRGRDSGNTIAHKGFPGGYAELVGANSPASLAMRPVRLLLCDEVDLYPTSTGSEGDPIKLATKRTQTFYNRKHAYVSVPRQKDTSRIWPKWEESDKRRYHVPCPECGEKQHLVFQEKDPKGEIIAGLVWEQTEGGDHLPETVRYRCRHCGHEIPEREKFSMLSEGEWIPEVPGARIAGFHLNSLYSPWLSWQELVEDFLTSKGSPENLQVFVNERLAETWEERGEKPDAMTLESRRELYTDRKGRLVDVPHGVGLLTAGVDVQGSWLELLVKGWGAGEESWLITHWRIQGDPEQEDVWARLDHLLTKKYRHASGADLRIQCCMIDQGFLADQVQQFCRPRQKRNVFPSVGRDRHGAHPLTRTRRKKGKRVTVYTIGTISMKDTIFQRLKITDPGPGYMHFRQRDPDIDGMDAEYFKQFEAEKAVRRRHQGRYRRSYVQGPERNEAIDLEVLALAALHALGPDRERLGKLADELDRFERPDKPGSTSATKPGKSRRRGNSWVDRWKK